MKRIILIGLLALLAAGVIGAQPGPDYQADRSSRRTVRFEAEPAEAYPAPQRARRQVDPYPGPGATPTDVFGPPPVATPFSCPSTWTEEVTETQVCFYCPNDPEPATLMFCYPLPTAAPIDGPVAYPPPVERTPVPYPSPDICSGDPNPCEG